VILSFIALIDAAAVGPMESIAVERTELARGSRTAAPDQPVDSYRSAFGKSRKVLLCLQVPPHSADGVLPPTLHGLQGVFVTFIAPGDRLFQVSILCLDDIIGRICMERGIARPAHLFACHCFHDCNLSLVQWRHDPGQLIQASDKLVMSDYGTRLGARARARAVCLRRTSQAVAF
jgi:hypothetical protein